jgi:ribosome biogenesis GTPase A
MAKARREMTDSLRRVDAVLELVDARLPLASANPMLRELIGSKPKTVVLTRIDLADPHQTANWRTYFQSLGHPVVAVDARSGEGIKDILPALEHVSSAKREKDARKGIRPRPLRTMVVGIPNVGKSSLINRISGRASTSVGDRPGITKTQQWIRMGQVELLDTPGVLWPKLDDEKSAFMLAISGAIKSQLLDMESLCAFFFVWASGHYENQVKSRYEIAQLPDPNWVDVATAWQTTEEILQSIARHRGMFQAGGVPSTERAAELVIREIQTGKLGRMTFEWANEGKITHKDVEVADTNREST